jgi:hypothetical protein
LLRIDKFSQALLQIHDWCCQCIHGIDHRIAGDDNHARIRVFIDQVLPRPCGGREEQGTQGVNQPAMGLFRKRIFEIGCFLALLPHANRYLQVKRCQGADKTCGCIAMHQHQVRGLRFSIFIQGI